MLVNKDTFPLHGWLTRYDDLRGLGFTEEEINAAMVAAKVTFERLTMTVRHPYPKNGIAIHKIIANSKQPCILVKEGRMMMEISHPTDPSYTKNDTVDGYEIIIPSQWQNNAKILRELLRARLSWFDEFTWAIYGPNHYGKPEHEDIYLQIPDVTGPGKSLYCPVLALLHGHKELIIKRHTGYMQDYYGNAEQYLADALLAPLESLEAKKLFKYLDAYHG